MDERALMAPQTYDSAAHDVTDTDIQAKPSSDRDYKQPATVDK